MIYQDSSRTPQERAKDLLSRMSIEEKFAQVQCEFMERVEKVTKWPHGLGNVSCLAASIWENRQMTVDCIRSVQEYVMAQSEHHIPAIFHIETATGVLMPEASVYPNELARAASWNPKLEKEIGTEIGRQARVCGILQGLAPVLDLCRDPRMGRQGESLGEDPTLAAAMGVSYVQGLQNEEHGLSYSKFVYRDFTVDKKECHADETIEASVVAENAGSVVGTAVVQLYVTDEYASVSRPVMELIGFAKVELRAGEQKRVVFSIHPSQFAFLDEQMQWKIEKGEYTLKVAYASNQIAEEQSICVLEDAWIRGRDREFYCNTKEF